MTAIKYWVIVTYLIFSAANAILILTLWWVASFNNWRVTIMFNKLNEHWVEGVLFHVALLIAPYASWSIIKVAAVAIHSRRFPHDTIGN